MDNRKLGILALIAAGMVLWAVVQARISHRRRVPVVSGPAYLVQGLNPADIASITVGEGDKAVKIERKDGKYVIANKSDYPADTKQINDLITKVLDIQTIESYTSNPKNHEDLGVTEKKARTVVKLFKADGSLLTGVIIGEAQDGGQGTYVRLASSDEVYVAENPPWFRSGALEYVNQEIVNVKREDVNSVTVRTPEGSYTLRPAKGSGDGVVMENLPADRKLKDSDAKSVLTALTSVRFDDVNQPAQVEGLNFDHEYVCRLNNSTEYTIRLAKKGTKNYLQAQGRYTDPTKVTINTSQVDSPEELKKKEAVLLAQENAQKFTLRHKGWVYQIPDWKAKYLMEKQADLFEEKKPAEAKAETPASVPPPVVPPVEELLKPPAGPNQPAPAGGAPAVTPTPAPEQTPPAHGQRVDPNQP